MGTNCDLFLYYESDFMLSLSHENQANIRSIQFIILTFGWLDDLLNIDNDKFIQKIFGIFVYWTPG